MPIVIADSRRRIVLPEPAQPGQAYEVSFEGKGTFLVRRMVTLRAKLDAADAASKKTARARRSVEH